MLVVKNPPASAGDIRDMDSIFGLGRSPGGEHGNPLQYSCLENPRDRGAWWASVYGVAQSQTRLKRLSKRVILPTGLIGGSDGKASVYNVGDLGSIPGSGRFTGEGNGNPL